MKIQEIQIGRWVSFFEITKPDGTQSIPVFKNEKISQIAKQLYFKNYERPLRPIFEDMNLLSLCIESFLKVNEQKIHYIIESMDQEFLYTEMLSNTSSDNLSQDFNTDYYGGEGQTGKDTQESKVSSTSRTKNKKDILWNFSSASDNRLWYVLLDQICDTFDIDDDFRW